MAWLASSSCGDTKSERKQFAQLAEGCAINSDCINPYTCVFERCHEECTTDFDCPSVERCVQSGVAGLFVCQLPDDVNCSRDKDCAGDQICGIDQECRDPCLTALECTPTQICAASGECASSDMNRDVIDANNNIVIVLPEVPGPSTVASDDSSGGPHETDPVTSSAAGDDLVLDGTSGFEGPSSTTSESDSNEDLGTSSIPPGTTGTEDIGSSVDDPSNASTTDGGQSTYDYEEPSDGSPDGNDTRELAIPLLGVASIHLPRGDEDWFSVEVPSDGRAHILTFHLQQEFSLAAVYEVRAASDDSSIGAHVFPTGTTGEVSVTVGPGSTTLLRLTPQAGNDGGRAVLWVDDVPEQDDYEPNQDHQSAAAIAVGQEVIAQMVIPYTSSTDQNEEDWFTIDLASGMTTLEVSQIPADLRLWINLHDDEGTPLQNEITSAGQFRATVELDVLDGGQYYLRFLGYRAAGFGSHARPGEHLGYFEEPYIFRVEQ